MDANKKILFFKKNTSVHNLIFQDSKKAFEKLGCEVMVVRPETSATEINTILTTLKPDFVFSLDHTGINDEIFAEQKIPCFSWFTENPFYFITESAKTDYSYFLVPDKAYLSELKSYGFENVYYLPPAANPERMHTMERTNLHYMDISYIDTLGKRYTEWRKERNNEAKPPTKEILDLLITLKIQKPEITFERMFSFCDEKFKQNILQELDMKARGSIEYRIDMETTAYFKETYLHAFSKKKVTVFGDSAWKPVLPKHFYYSGNIDHEKDAGNIYRFSKINLNIVPTYIQTGINQRLLDIAATGAIFLTSYRKNIQDFFECDLRYLMFKSESDLLEKSEYFMKTNEVRNLVGNDLFESIYHKHTYNHRIKEMLDIFKTVTA